MAKVTYRQANKRYRALFVPLIVVYVGLCFGGPYLLDRVADPAVWLRAAVALVSAAPIAFVFVAIWRYLGETDEFTRHEQTASLAAGGMITAGIATAWGFLELYNVAPSLWTFLLGPTFFASYGLVHAWRAIRARAGSDSGP